MEPLLDSATDDELGLLRECVERELMRCRMEGTTKMKHRIDRLEILLDAIDQRRWERVEDHDA